MNQYPFPAAPMSVGKILDYSINTYIKKFSSFALFTLLINGIFTLVFFCIEQYFFLKSGFNTASLVQIFQDVAADPENMDEILSRLTEISQSMSPSWLAIISFTASLFITPFVMGGIASISTGYFLGEDHKPGEWFSLVRSKYKSLFIAFICSSLLLIGIMLLMMIALVFIFVLFGLLTALVPFLGILMFIALGIAFLVAIFFIIGVFSMIYPVVICEDQSGFAPLTRAFRIGFSKFWKTIGVFLIASLATGIVSGIASAMINGIAGLTSLASFIFVAALIGEVISLLVSPVVMIAMNLNYLSARIEKEGYLAAPIGSNPIGSNSVESHSVESHSMESGAMGQSLNFNTYLNPTDPQAAPSEAPKTEEPVSGASSATEVKTGEPTTQDPDKKNNDSQGPELL